MPFKRSLVTASLSCLLAFLPALGAGAESRFDGHFWRQADLQTRHFFVYSFMSGVVQGQDRVAARLLIKSDAGEFRPECHQAVAKNVNVLERELTRLDRAQFISAMDAFYGLKKNRALELKWAVLVVMQQLKGSPQSDLENFIEELRRQAP
jgi:hypothetical protein